jgi:N-acetylmuramoyl-L-alanine amidase
MNKKWTALAVASILLGISPTVFSAQGGPPRVIVNETPVTFPVPPRVAHGVLIAPLGPLAASFGATVVWNGASRQGTVVSRAGAVVRLALGDAEALVGGARVTLPVAPTRQAGTVWVPAAALLRALGAYVKTGEDGQVVEALSQVIGITWRRGRDGTVLRVTATGPVKAQAHMLTDPDRVTLDVSPAVASLRESKIVVNDPDVAAVRAAQFSVRPYVTRIVLDLVHPVPSYGVVFDGEGLALTLSRSASTLVSPSPPVSPPPPGSTASPSPAGPSPDSTVSPSRREGSRLPGSDVSVSTPASPPPGPIASPSPPARPPLPGSTASPAEPPRNGPGVGTSVILEHPNGTAAPEPLASPPVPEFPDGPGAFHIRSVRYNVEGGTGRLTIAASQPMAPVVHRLTYPDRLAIDLPGGVFVPRREDLEVGSDAVRNIVIAQLTVEPNLTRVVVYLTRPATYTTVSADGGRALSFALADITRAAKRLPTVVIDPGHGGADTGAIGPTGLRESDVNLDIGRMVQHALQRQQVRAVLTRTDDSTVALEDRTDIGRREGGIVFVSIHANGSVNVAKRGTETYYATRESATLAALVHSEVVQALREPDRGIRPADFYVIVNMPMPAVLLEIAYISDAGEERLLRDPVVQQRVADAIARAIVRFLAGRTATAAP